LLHSLRNVKEEYKFRYKFETWEEMLNRAIPLSNSSPVVEDPAVLDEPPNADLSDQTTADSSGDSSPLPPVPSRVS
jgi:hypothetical protein